MAQAAMAQESQIPRVCVAQVCACTTYVVLRHATRHFLLCAVSGNLTTHKWDDWSATGKEDEL